VLRTGPKLLSMCVPVAVVAILVAVACTPEAEGPVQSVAYYRSHPAEWERRVWVCTNEPGTLEHTPECAHALLALPRADEPLPRSDAGSSSVASLRLK
jgi:hypothetical protein